MASFTHDDWLTPLYILRPFGQFDLDPCMPIAQPWHTARTHYTIVEDGLTQPWFGRVWLNPPYSDIGAWIAKLLTHLKNGGSGMALYNARTQTRWFFAGVWDCAYAVCFPQSKIPFVRPDGTSRRQGFSASVLCAYSDRDAAILAANHPPGKFIPLRFKLIADITTTWRRLVRFLMKQCAGVCTLEQLYRLISEHPKCAANPNWKAKVRQTVQREARRIGPALWQTTAYSP